MPRTDEPTLPCGRRHSRSRRRTSRFPRLPAGPASDFRDERPAPSRWRCTTLHPRKRNFHTPPHEIRGNLGEWPPSAQKRPFACGVGHSGALDRRGRRVHVQAHGEPAPATDAPRNHSWEVECFLSLREGRQGRFSFSPTERAHAISVKHRCRLESPVGPSASPIPFVQHFSRASPP